MYLGRQQTHARNQGGTDALSSALRAAIMPVAQPLATTCDTVGDFFHGLFRASALTAENRRLRSMLHSAQLYEERVEFLLAEVRNRQRLLDVPPMPGRSRVAAPVVGFYPHENRITIGAGRDKGISKGMPAVAPEGLVGVVQTVDAHTAQVLLVHSARFTVGAMVRRDPPPAGLLRGDSPQSLILDSLDMESTVRVGDEVMTLGASERIPAGIPIGRIVQIHRDPTFGRVWCQVFPNVQIGSVREVWVIR